MPTHRDYPWERDARVARRKARQRRSYDEALSAAERSIVRTHRSRRMRRLPIWFGLFAVVAIVVLSKTDQHRSVPPSVATPSVGSQPQSQPQSPSPVPATVNKGAAAPSGGSVTTLHSRFADRTVIEIWGRTSAQDGSSIRLRLSAEGAGSRRLADAPAVGGRFYSRAALPEAMRGRRVRITAGVGS